MEMSSSSRCHAGVRGRTYWDSRVDPNLITLASEISEIPVRISLSSHVLRPPSRTPETNAIWLAMAMLQGVSSLKESRGHSTTTDSRSMLYMGAVEREGHVLRKCSSRPAMTASHKQAQASERDQIRCATHVVSLWITFPYVALQLDALRRAAATPVG